MKTIRASIAFVSFALTALALAGCSEKTGSASAAPPKSVSVVKAWMGPGALPISVHGVLAYRDEMRLAFKMPGVIKSIAVNAGDKVHKGQTLAQIEMTEVNAQLSQAQETDIKAQRDLERAQRLFRDQVISEEQLQNLQTQRAMAAAQLRSAQFNRGYAQITAPADGVVLQRLAQAHEQVGPGTPVLVVGGADRGYVVRAELSDRDIVRVKNGDAAQVWFDALPGRSFESTITQRSHGADDRSGLFPIEATVAAPTGLDSGMLARLSLPVQTGVPELVHVPIAAIVEGDGRRASVYVLEHERARRRAVEVAFIDIDSVAINSGVQAGEPVITDGASWVDDNDAVRVATGAPQ